jgi:hypothetical protein
MFRALFIAGTLLGFWFGSSKKGQQMRQKMDGAVTDLLSEGSETLDHAKSELSKDFDKAKGLIFGTASKDGGKQNGNGKRDQEKGGKDAAPEGKEQAKSPENNQSNKEQKKDQLKESDKQPEVSAQDGPEVETSPPEGKELDAEKAQELADKLGAKPATPEDENLAAFHPTDDGQRKSA